MSHVKKDGRITRYAIGVVDGPGPGDFRMITKEDWKRTRKGDTAVSLTSDVRQAKLWRSVGEVELAAAEFGMRGRGYVLFPVGVLPGVLSRRPS